MKWSETSIARALAVQFFNKKYLVVVPNCIWTGYEADVLAVTNDLRLIDVEIKISRADLKADAKKDKWRLSYLKNPATGYHERLEPPQARQHPHKIWKHYYAIPKEIWSDELLDSLPSKSSGVLLLWQKDTYIGIDVKRRATPCKNADKISPQNAIDIARLASLRMWDSYKQLDEMRRAA